MGSLWPLCQFQLSLCLKEWYLSRLVRFCIWRWHSCSEDLAAATLRLLLLCSLPTCTVQSSTKTSSGSAVVVKIAAALWFMIMQILWLKLKLAMNTARYRNWWTCSKQVSTTIYITPRRLLVSSSWLHLSRDAVSPCFISSLFGWTKSLN
jgi:hypothetical protein